MNSSNNSRKIFEDCFNPKTKIYKVYCVLKDRKWHCRNCAYTHVKSRQIAGSGGIQGLQRGTSKREGMEIVSENRKCNKCKEVTMQDRWTGELNQPIIARNMPRKFAHRVYCILGFHDVVEQSRREPGQIMIDHKLPMIRWNNKTGAEQTNYNKMTDEEIREKFQLLKITEDGNHNLLKSRSCEKCYESNIRGTPFGISFFYSGGRKWNGKNKKDPDGCKGCGWYDFNQWRIALNNKIKNKKKRR